MKEKANPIKTRTFGNSTYWLSNNIESLMESENLYKLAASKRAVSNFVTIVTGQPIPVKFATKNSYTDGKTVTIGAKLEKPEDFDVTVGLALHEASHIILSDFALLRNLYSLVPPKTESLSFGAFGIIRYDLIKGIWNWVEDRRIDHYIYTTSPGYRDYYHAMYDRYFNSPLIDKGLLSGSYRDEDIESYMFRLINLTNPNTDLDALLKLREIYSVVDLRNIGRLKSSKNALTVAINIFDIIASAVTEYKATKQNTDSNTNSSKSKSSDEGESNGMESSSDSIDNDTDDDDEISGDDMDDILNSLEDGDDTNSDGSMSIDGLPADGGTESDSTEFTEPTPKKLSVEAKSKLDSWLKKQSDFIMGDVNKKAISRKAENELQVIEETNSKLVDSEFVDEYNRVQKVECVVVNKLTESLLASYVFPLRGYGEIESRVSEGLLLGATIGKRLQVRNETNTTTYNRQNRGKLDKRMISSLGYGNESIFQYQKTDSYKKANLHISVDASSSMSGSKWNKTMINVVALCKAIEMIPNLEVQVSFRTTTRGRASQPYLLIAYDSRVDKISKIKKMFGRLEPNGTTPEGLLFPSIFNVIPKSTNELDSYFLNISDGYPQYNYYTGRVATKHTREQVRKFEDMGIKILSYFIDEDSYGFQIKSKFTEMYGAGARFIDVNSSSDVVKTMNQLFLAK